MRVACTGGRIRCFSKSAAAFGRDTPLRLKFARNLWELNAHRFILNYLGSTSLLEIGGKRWTGRGLLAANTPRPTPTHQPYRLAFRRRVARPLAAFRWSPLLRAGSLREDCACIRKLLHCICTGSGGPNGTAHTHPGDARPATETATATTWPAGFPSSACNSTDEGK